LVLMFVLVSVLMVAFTFAFVSVSVSVSACEIGSVRNSRTVDQLDTKSR
jgi:hypothetical protein